MTESKASDEKPFILSKIIPELFENFYFKYNTKPDPSKTQKVIDDARNILHCMYWNGFERLEYGTLSYANAEIILKSINGLIAHELERLAETSYENCEDSEKNLKALISIDFNLRYRAKKYLGTPFLEFTKLLYTNNTPSVINKTLINLGYAVLQIIQSDEDTSNSAFIIEHLQEVLEHQQPYFALLQNYGFDFVKIMESFETKHKGKSVKHSRFKFSTLIERILQEQANFPAFLLFKNKAKIVDLSRKAAEIKPNNIIALHKIVLAVFGYNPATVDKLVSLRLYGELHFLFDYVTACQSKIHATKILSKLVLTYQLVWIMRYNYEMGWSILKPEFKNRAYQIPLLPDDSFKRIILVIKKEIEKNTHTSEDLELLLYSSTFLLIVAAMLFSLGSTYGPYEISLEDQKESNLYNKRLTFEFIEKFFYDPSDKQTKYSAIFDFVELLQNLRRKEIREALKKNPNMNLPSTVEGEDDSLIDACLQMLIALVENLSKSRVTVFSLVDQNVKFYYRANMSHFFEGLWMLRLFENIMINFDFEENYCSQYILSISSEVLEVYFYTQDYFPLVRMTEIHKNFLKLIMKLNDETLLKSIDSRKDKELIYEQVLGVLRLYYVLISRFLIFTYTLKEDNIYSMEHLNEEFASIIFPKCLKQIIDKGLFDRYPLCYYSIRLIFLIALELLNSSWLARDNFLTPYHKEIEVFFQSIAVFYCNSGDNFTEFGYLFKMLAQTGEYQKYLFEEELAHLMFESAFLKSEKPLIIQYNVVYSFLDNAPTFFQNVDSDLKSSFVLCLHEISKKLAEKSKDLWNRFSKALDNQHRDIEGLIATKQTIFANEYVYKTFYEIYFHILSNYSSDELFLDYPKLLNEMLQIYSSPFFALFRYEELVNDFVNYFKAREELKSDWWLAVFDKLYVLADRAEKAAKKLTFVNAGKICYTYNCILNLGDRDAVTTKYLIESALSKEDLDILIYLCFLHNIAFKENPNFKEESKGFNAIWDIEYLDKAKVQNLALKTIEFFFALYEKSVRTLIDTTPAKEVNMLLEHEESTFSEIIPKFRYTYSSLFGHFFPCLLLASRTKAKFDESDFSIILFKILSNLKSLKDLNFRSTKSNIDPRKEMKVRLLKNEFSLLLLNEELGPAKIYAEYRSTIFDICTTKDMLHNLLHTFIYCSDLLPGNKDLDPTLFEACQSNIDALRDLIFLKSTLDKKTKQISNKEEKQLTLTNWKKDDSEAEVKIFDLFSILSDFLETIDLSLLIKYKVIVEFSTKKWVYEPFEIILSSIGKLDSYLQQLGDEDGSGKTLSVKKSFLNTIREQFLFKLIPFFPYMNNREFEQSFKLIEGDFAREIKSLNGIWSDLFDLVMNELSRITLKTDIKSFGRLSSSSYYQNEQKYRFHEETKLDIYGKDLSKLLYVSFLLRYLYNSIRLLDPFSNTGHYSIPLSVKFDLSTVFEIFEAILDSEGPFSHKLFGSEQLSPQNACMAFCYTRKINETIMDIMICVILKVLLNRQDLPSFLGEKTLNLEMDKFLNESCPKIVIALLKQYKALNGIVEKNDWFKKLNMDNKGAGKLNTLLLSLLLMERYNPSLETSKSVGPLKEMLASGQLYDMLNTTQANKYYDLLFQTVLNLETSWSILTELRLKSIFKTTNLSVLQFKNYSEIFYFDNSDSRLQEFFKPFSFTKTVDDFFIQITDDAKKSAKLEIEMKGKRYEAEEAFKYILSPFAKRVLRVFLQNLITSFETALQKQRLTLDQSNGMNFLIHLCSNAPQIIPFVMNFRTKTNLKALLEKKNPVLLHFKAQKAPQITFYELVIDVLLFTNPEESIKLIRLFCSEKPPLLFNYPKDSTAIPFSNFLQMKTILMALEKLESYVESGEKILNDFSSLYIWNLLMDVIAFIIQDNWKAETASHPLPQKEKEARKKIYDLLMALMLKTLTRIALSDTQCDEGIRRIGDRINFLLVHFSSTFWNKKETLKYRADCYTEFIAHIFDRSALKHEQPKFTLGEAVKEIPWKDTNGFDWEKEEIETDQRFYNNSDLISNLTNCLFEGQALPPKCRLPSWLDKQLNFSLNSSKLLKLQEYFKAMSGNKEAFEDIEKLISIFLKKEASKSAVPALLQKDEQLMEKIFQIFSSKDGVFSPEETLSKFKDVIPKQIQDDKRMLAVIPGAYDQSAAEEEKKLNDEKAEGSKLKGDEDSDDGKESSRTEEWQRKGMTGLNIRQVDKKLLNDVYDEVYEITNEQSFEFDRIDLSENSNKRKAVYDDNNDYSNERPEADNEENEEEDDDDDAGDTERGYQANTNGDEDNEQSIRVRFRIRESRPFENYESEEPDLAESDAGYQVDGSEPSKDVAHSKTHQDPIGKGDESDDESMNDRSRSVVGYYERSQALIEETKSSPVIRHRVEEKIDFYLKQKADGLDQAHNAISLVSRSELGLSKATPLAHQHPDVAFGVEDVEWEEVSPDQLSKYGLEPKSVRRESSKLPLRLKSESLQNGESKEELDILVEKNSPELQIKDNQLQPQPNKETSLFSNSEAQLELDRSELQKIHKIKRDYKIFREVRSSQRCFDELRGVTHSRKDDEKELLNFLKRFKGTSKNYVKFFLKDDDLALLKRDPKISQVRREMRSEIRSLVEAFEESFSSLSILSSNNDQSEESSQNSDEGEEIPTESNLDRQGDNQNTTHNNTNTNPDADEEDNATINATNNEPGQPTEEKNNTNTVEVNNKDDENLDKIELFFEEIREEAKLEESPEENNETKLYETSRGYFLQDIFHINSKDIFVLISQTFLSKNPLVKSLNILSYLLVNYMNEVLFFNVLFSLQKLRTPLSKTNQLRSFYKEHLKVKIEVFEDEIVTHNLFSFFAKYFKASKKSLMLPIFSTEPESFLSEDFDSIVQRSSQKGVETIFDKLIQLIDSPEIWKDRNKCLAITLFFNILEGIPIQNLCIATYSTVEQYRYAVNRHQFFLSRPMATKLMFFVVQCLSDYIHGYPQQICDLILKNHSVLSEIYEDVIDIIKLNMEQIVSEIEKRAPDLKKAKDAPELFMKVRHFLRTPEIKRLSLLISGLNICFDTSDKPKEEKKTWINLLELFTDQFLNDPLLLYFLRVIFDFLRIFDSYYSLENRHCFYLYDFSHWINSLICISGLDIQQRELKQKNKRTFLELDDDIIKESPLHQLDSGRGGKFPTLKDSESTISLVKFTSKGRKFDPSINDKSANDIMSEGLYKIKNICDFVIVNYVQNIDNDKILKEFVKRYPFALALEAKENLAKLRLVSNPEDYDVEEQHITIRRSHLFEDSLKLLKFTDMELKVKLTVTYQNEEGVDAGGLKRGWFNDLAKFIFNPAQGLFLVSETKRSIRPNFFSRLVPEHLKYFELAGLLIAKAIHENCTVDVHFTRGFLKQILGKPLNLNDLEDIDPNLTKSLSWILKNDVTGLEQTYSYELDILGERHTKELKPGGDKIEVTNLNKFEFVKLLALAKMRDEINDQIKAFIKGFRRIIKPEQLTLLSPKELDLLIAGQAEIEVKEMRKYAQYQGFDSNSQVIEWFWDIMDSFDKKDKSSLLYFISGSTNPPYGGFKNMQLKISRSERVDVDHDDLLPVGHTCFFELELPNYRSKQKMKEKLLFAIYEGAEGYYLA